MAWPFGLSVLARLAVEGSPGPRAADAPPTNGGGAAGWRPLVGLVVVGCLFEALVIAFIALVSNLPEGYTITFGLSREGLGLFQAVWPYPRLALEAGQFTLLTGLTILALWATYALGLAWLRSPAMAVDSRPGPAVILGFAGLFNLTLALFLPAVLSADVFSYALYGRMIVFHGANPYLPPGGSLVHDLFWPLAQWRGVPQRYGPVWTLLSAALGLAGGSSVLLTVIAFKLVAGALNLANGVLVAAIARELDADPRRSLILYSWNPLVLIEAAGSGHSDVLMVTLALSGLLLLLRGSWGIGVAALTASILVKYVTVLLLIMALGRIAARSGHRWKTVVLRLASISGAVSVTLYLPFVIGGASIPQLIADAAPFDNRMASPIHRPLVVAAIWLTHQLGSTAVPGDLEVTRALSLGLAVLMALVVRRISRSDRPLAEPTGWREVLDIWSLTTLVFLVVVYGGAYPWYFILPIASIVVGPPSPFNRRLSAACMGLGVALMLLYAHLLLVP